MIRLPPSSTRIDTLFPVTTLFRSTEVSGVCTRPGWRGRGFAAELLGLVARRIAARGETPFLHAYADHNATIALYERLGFAVRAQMRSEVHTSELQSLMRSSYAVLCLNTKTNPTLIIYKK